MSAAELAPMEPAEVRRVRQVAADNAAAMMYHASELASAVRRSDFDAEDAGYALDQFGVLWERLHDDLYYLRGLLEGSYVNE